MTILLLGSSPYSFAANSFTCISKDKTIAPRGITNEWKEADGDWNRRQNWVCCENLVFNPTTRVCEYKSMIDVRFKFCNSHSECAIGPGCFPQSTPELYTTDSLDPNEIVIWNAVLAGVTASNACRHWFVVMFTRDMSHSPFSYFFTILRLNDYSIFRFILWSKDNNQLILN